MGKHRIDLGYSEFKIKKTGFEDADLGTDEKTGKVYGVRRVPKGIDVVATRPAAQTGEQK
ncbi:MAG: hypothetical protein HYY17_11885 [Planctomycetes bacterium]|nr:hypothetical protein [Planctomycetota bacterium]